MNLELELKRLAMVTLGSAIFVIGISVFIVPANLIPGGFTGIATLLQYGLGTLGISINLGLLVVLVNIPIMIIGMVAISKTFVYYSVYSILLQGFLIGFLDYQSPLFEGDYLATSVLGGLAVGLGASIALKSGASLGGLDILAQIFALKFQISIGYISLLINAFILAISLLIFDPQIAFYTLVMFAIANQLVDRIHTAYKRVRLDIITMHSQRIKDALIQNSVRGITILDGVGAYTGQKRQIMVMVTQVHEVYDIKRIIVEVDSEAFITMTPVRHLNGKFNRVILK